MTTPDAALPPKGVDYSTDHPKISSLTPNGVKFAIRYTSPGANPKNLTAAELKALLAAGLHVCLVFESVAGRILEGHAAGAADAHVADTACHELGMTGLPVYFACDVDPHPLTSLQWGRIAAYLDGAASVIGHARTGGYGGYLFIRNMFDDHAISYGWQTYAWSGGVWDARAQLRQVRNGVPMGGGTVDIDEAHARDYGQFPRPIVHTGPFRHVVPNGNTLTLADVATARHTTVDHIAQVTLANTDAQHHAIFSAYLTLDGYLHANGLPHPVMPEGMVYWTSNK